MSYVRSKMINGYGPYYYRVKSVREGDNVRQVHIAYLGKTPPKGEVKSPKTSSKNKPEEQKKSKFPSEAAEMNYNAGLESGRRKMLIGLKSETRLNNEFGDIARAARRDGEKEIWYHRGQWDGVNKSLPPNLQRQRNF